MSRVLVLYYSMYGHVAAMARSVAAGARSVPDVEVTVKKVPELMPADAAARAGAASDPTTPAAVPDELEQYDAIIFGTPTRFGNMAAQMRNFIDQTGGAWMRGALIGKIGSVFVSTGTGGGNETTITSFHTTLLHHGMIIVGLPYSAKALTDLSEVKGGSPLSAGTIAGLQGERRPSAKELELAHFQGRHVATLSRALMRGRRELDAGA